MRKPRAGREQSVRLWRSSRWPGVGSQRSVPVPQPVTGPGTIAWRDRPPAPIPARAKPPEDAQPAPASRSRNSLLTQYQSDRLYRTSPAQSSLLPSARSLSSDLRGAPGPPLVIRRRFGRHPLRIPRITFQFNNRIRTTVAAVINDRLTHPVRLLMQHLSAASIQNATTTTHPDLNCLNPTWRLSPTSKLRALE